MFADFFFHHRKNALSVFNHLYTNFMKI